MKNVLVTGGSGFIGIEVIRHLNDAGITPRVLIRRPHRASLLNAPCWCTRSPRPAASRRATA